jgi:V/A-type H+/Na+-transporting ATPase subunit E
MALSDILEKIKKEAAAKVAELEKEYKAKIEDLEKANKEKQKDIDEEMHRKVEENNVKIIAKAENLAEIERKNQLLHAKREILEEALEGAIDELSKLDNYEEIIANMLEKAELKGDNTVVVPAKGKEEATKAAIQKSGKNYFLSEKSANMAGGFILKTDTVEIDNSFSTIVKEQLREDLEIKLHKLLF